METYLIYLGILISLPIVMPIILKTISKIIHRKQIKVEGTITEFIIENGCHYPVFSFTTKDGRVITKRNIQIINNEKIEISVEELLTFPAAQEFIAQVLPIKDIIIYYNKDNPEEFEAKWV